MSAVVETLKSTIDDLREKIASSESHAKLLAKRASEAADLLNKYKSSLEEHIVALAKMESGNPEGGA